MTTPQPEPPEPGARPQSPAVPLWPGMPGPEPVSDDRTTQPRPAIADGQDTTVPRPATPPPTTTVAQPSGPTWLRPPAEAAAEPNPTLVDPGGSYPPPGTDRHPARAPGRPHNQIPGQSPGRPDRQIAARPPDRPPVDAARPGPKPPAITGPVLPYRPGRTDSAVPPERYIPGVNTMAIAALIFAFLFPPAGIVMGHIAKGQLRLTGESGKGIATAALTIGYAITLCACCLPVGLVLGIPIGL